MDVVTRVLGGVVAVVVEVENIRGKAGVEAGIEIEGGVGRFANGSVVNGDFREWKGFVLTLVVELRDSEDLLHSLIGAFGHAILLVVVR